MTRRKLGSTELKRLHRDWRRRTEGRLALVLEDVQGPYNVGAILRTAAAYRVDSLWTCGLTPDPDTPKVGKTALGSERFVAVERVDSGAEAVAEARRLGYRVVALELAEGAVPVHEADLAGDVCVAVGNEDRGLSTGLLDAADLVVYLPQLGRIGSLNVATATAIACWEVRRRAWPTNGNETVEGSG